MLRRDDDDVCSRPRRHNYLLIQLDRGRFPRSPSFAPLRPTTHTRSSFSVEFTVRSFSPEAYTVIRPVIIESNTGQNRHQSTANPMKTFFFFLRYIMAIHIVRIHKRAHARVNPLVSDTDF